MRETEDPREALRATKDLPLQAAAARDLAKMGTWDDVFELLELATTHKRTGLRLSAAAAAADILHRYRTGAATPALTRSQVDEILAWSLRTDPGHNPSGLMVLAAFPETKVVERLGRLLRDPRGDVRAGAAVTIRRMALSHVDLDLSVLYRAFGGWLSNRKSTGDGLLEIVRLVGDVGLPEHKQAVLDVVGTSAPVTEAAEIAVARLAAREDPASWSGLWVSDGLDVLEQDASPRKGSWLLWHDGKVVRDGSAAKDAPLAGDRVRLGRERARLIWAPRIGVPEPGPALQVTGRTWFKVEDPKLLVEWMEEHADALGPDQAPATAALLKAFDGVEGALAARGTLIAKLLCGDAEGALADLEPMMTGKKPRNDLFYWRGRAEEVTGGNAAESYRTYLERAGKKARLRPDAEARLARLEAT